MGSYQEAYGVLTTTTAEAADAIREELADLGFLDKKTKSAWEGENGGTTASSGHVIIFNGGTMRNIVNAVEGIVEAFAEKIDTQRTILRGVSFDGDFALYEFNGKKMARLDDEELPEIVEGFSWEKWEELEGTEDFSFEEDANRWLLDIEVYSIIEEEEKVEQLKAWAESAGYRIEYKKNAKLEGIYNAYSKLPHHDEKSCIKAHLYSTPQEAVMAAATWLHDSYKGARSVALPSFEGSAA